MTDIEQPIRESMEEEKVFKNLPQYNLRSKHPKLGKPNQVYQDEPDAETVTGPEDINMDASKVNEELKKTELFKASEERSKKKKEFKEALIKPRFLGPHEVLRDAVKSLEREKLKPSIDLSKLALFKNTKTMTATFAVPSLKRTRRVRVFKAGKTWGIVISPD